MNAPPGNRKAAPRFKPAPLAKEIGDRLREARLDRGLSQSELGKLLQTRVGTAVAGSKISQYEKGRAIPAPPLRRQLARALERPEEELFGAADAALADRPSPSPDPLHYAVLANRLERVEDELKDLRRRVETHETERRKQRDEEDAAAAARAAEEADLRDQASRKPSPRSRGKRPSKDRRR